jgi:hypothetical protein
MQLPVVSIKIKMERSDVGDGATCSFAEKCLN